MTPKPICSTSICQPTFTSSRIFKVLAAWWMFLLLSQLAFADHVHHLWYNNSEWQDQDLTILTNREHCSRQGRLGHLHDAQRPIPRFLLRR